MSQPPLPAETRYWRHPDDRQRVVNALFDRSAEHYDRACGIMSFGAGQGYRRQALGRAGLRPGMRVLNPADGFPELPGCRVGLIRNPHESLALADALAEHIISSLDNLSEAAQAAE